MTLAYCSILEKQHSPSMRAMQEWSSTVECRGGSFVQGFRGLGVQTSWCRSAVVDGLRFFPEGAEGLLGGS